ncbi:hypothetical protein L226DRAFT_557238 [Lentinus tigrinus ALCF2SS1-7]|uniref:Uncharacterized protein n=1 Tax=Lentinus tigrinus ALCF2SS1-6 TaxID=1328759 RepID=A0A5C2SS57_9APHY|nr:hypothetical protein L227DRAFT_127240 [Lentinus tigrinus ALCF2SS1-6]RPD79895.1 hypothetical protein L226DRAFT_557238 [Lentinus tigrinus ALCF2SS1-7]
MTSQPTVDLEAGDTPGCSNHNEPAGEATSSTDGAAANDGPDEFKEMVEHPWGIAISLYWVLSACISLVISNTVVILSGHLLLLYILPFSRAFMASSLPSTLAMAALGSSILALPVFAAGMIVVGFAVGIRIGSLAVLRTVIYLHQNLRSSRLMPPHADTFLWQVWMVAAGPIGFLVYDTLFPQSKNHLNMVEVLIAAALPRILWFGSKYTRKALVPPMPELRPANAPPGMGTHTPELRPADATKITTQAEQVQLSEASAREAGRLRDEQMSYAAKAETGGAEETIGVGEDR